MADADAPTAPGGIDQAGLEMFAACVEANVRATESATNRVFENYEWQLANLRRDFVEFYDLVYATAAVITTRKLEAALKVFESARDDAEGALRKEDY